MRASNFRTLLRNCLCVLALAAAALMPCAASAQSSNQDPCGDGSGIMPVADKSLGVCGLDDTEQAVVYEGDLSIPFSIRSCWADWEGNEWSTAYCSKSRDYTMEVIGPAQGQKFLLSGPSGNVAVTLEFHHPSTTATTIIPGQVTSTRFRGAANGQQTPVYFSLTPDSTVAPAPGIYRGTLQLYLYQCNPWGDPNNPYDPIICKGSTASDNRTELNPPLTLDIALVVGSSIRISGLEDMVLQMPNPLADITAEQHFCVYTTANSDFSLRADSLNGNGEFLLGGVSSSDTIAYEINILSEIPPKKKAKLTEGVFTKKDWKGHASLDCTGYSDENMLLELTIPAANLANPQDYQYMDTLTLTVEMN
ncbi:hypothetical protein [Microbulbifer pacificus]|uniref:Spore coat protein U domain-containing protein n=1 Tax=Microbulbifer pacificus TaxID=407164 RepID=A0AAU0MZF6_9GAMM|nr:hypothetical protein [Microbulbifer pacificus]WOX04819.1 hypothetical protein R5R33_13865 [Microbulbifer pacificus]